MEKMMKNLKYIANKLFVPAEYEKFLNLASRFPNLNLYNLLLLYYQMPTATLVAGQNAWKDNYGLNVKENEQAICLLRPTLDDNEVLGYSQIGVFDVSQLERIPEIKKEIFSIADFYYEATGIGWSYDFENLLEEDREYVILDDEVIIRQHKELSDEENENNVNKQLLLAYIENYCALSTSNAKEMAIMQGMTYILCVRYGFEPIKFNSTVLSNCKGHGLEFFLELLGRTNEIIDQIENKIYVEFNFAETAFVDLLNEADIPDDFESILDLPIEFDDDVLTAVRETFVEKLEMISPTDYNRMVESRKNNKMLTQPPYRIKLIEEN